MLHWFGRIYERLLLKILLRRQFDSIKLRTHFSKTYGIDVGMYSYGCFDPTRIRPGVRFGKYCSVAPSVNIFTRNHPIDALTTHPVVYEQQLGLGRIQALPFKEIEIEDDVWIGHNVVILPGVERIGRGCVIGAGSIVTRSLPRYAVAAGNPARELRKRFDESTIAKIEESRWWELSIAELSIIARNNPDFVFNPAALQVPKP